MTILNTDPPALGPAVTVTGFATASAPEASTRAVAKVRAPVYVWVHKSLARGYILDEDETGKPAKRPLHPSTVLKGVAGLSRRDNTTKIMTWRSTDVGARTGTTAQTCHQQVLDDLVLAGVVSGYTRQGPRSAYIVTFVDPVYTERLEVPQAACWTTKWLDGRIVGPRYGKDTDQVLRWLLAILIASDFAKSDLRIVNDMGIDEICRRSGLNRTAYVRAWNVVRRVCTDDPWINWDETISSQTGGVGKTIITIDWSLLPDLLEPPETTGKPVNKALTLVSDTAVTLVSDTAVTLVSNTAQRYFPTPPYKEVSSVSQFSPINASLPSSVVTVDSDRQDTSTTRKGREGMDGETEQPRENKPVQTVDTSANCSAPITATAQTSKRSNRRTNMSAGLTTALTAAIAGTAPEGGADITATNETSEYDAWLLAVLSIITGQHTPNRLPLTLSDARHAHTAVLSHYEGGWSAEGLARWLTYLSNKVDSPSSAFRARVKKAPHTPPAERVASTSEARRKAADQAAFAAIAFSRSADKYTQRTM